MFEYDNDYKKDINIKLIITMHYFEFTPEYAYNGETHDFWEMVYIDKGELNVVADGKTYDLKQGDIIFHMPNEFHSIYSAGNNAPNVVIISFDTSSPAMAFFEKKIFKIPEEKSFHIANIMNEAKGAFNPELGGLFMKESRLSDPVFGSEQLMYGYLELFLIDLYRSANKQAHGHGANETDMDGINITHSKLIDDIIDYMKHNLDKNLKLQDLVDEFYVGNTYLKVLFKKCMGDSVLCYFRKLKMREAKRLIRENQHNFSEISKLLGFESIHYFSASFKKHYGMCPTEYIKSIRTKEEILKSQADT